MYLKLKSEKPEKDLFLNCPYNFKEKHINVFNCVNCQDPLCLKACKYGAIKKDSKTGIVTIDSKKCVGCGACVKACKNNAIVLIKNKAKKCDLCFNNSFLMPCFYNNKEMLELVDENEIKEKEILSKYFGFIVEDIKTEKTLSLDSSVIIDKNNEKRYIVNYQKLSLSEIELINDILDNYKTDHTNKEIDNMEITESIKKDLDEILVNYCFNNSIELDDDQFKYILECAVNILSDLGPLSLMLKDNDLEEIVIFDIDESAFVYHKNFGWLKTNIVYKSLDCLKDLINKMSWESSKYITLKNPLLDITLKNHTRLNAVINPITDSISITIRKFPVVPFTVTDLLSQKIITKEVFNFLKKAFLTDSNIFVCGNTGSGKTTTLNALLEFIPKSERMVLVEEVREINISHPHKVSLIVNKDQNILLDSLVINTLRMRPDRVIIGEVRSKEEILSLIDSILCGQAKGTYTTIHAQSSNDAILRLRSYGVLEQDIGSIDLIINQRRYNEYNKDQIIERRKIMEISEVVFDNTKQKIFLNKLFEYDSKKNILIKKNNSLKLINKFKISKLGNKI
jgi:archaeal flagellar protein FlaI